MQAKALLSGVVPLSFWFSGEVQMCMQFTEYISRPEGCDLNTKGFEPYQGSCILTWMYQRIHQLDPIGP